MTDTHKALNPEVSVSNEGAEQIQKYQSFDDLDLKFTLLKGIYGKGYS